MCEAIGDSQVGVSPQLGPIHRLQQEVVEGEFLVGRRFGACLRIDQLELVTPVKRSGVPAFGLTQIQSSPVGGRQVPLVSMAMVKPRSESSRTRAASSCSSGSPPVQTTNGSLPVQRGHCAAMAVGKIAWRARTCRHSLRWCRQNRCRRKGKPPSAGPPRARSTGYSRRSGKTPPGVRRCTPSPCSV